jgi:hypothetical protein
MDSPQKTPAGSRPLDLLPHPRFEDFLIFAGTGPAQRPDENLPRLQFVGSGKAAIAAVLAHLREIGTLRNKMSEVFVPKWLGYPVYQAMTEYCFPTQNSRSESKVLLAYHQYGFPQDMQRVKEYADFRKMTLIEDCAHACDSSYQGRRLGTLGDYAVFSFSKFAFCAALGGVSSSSAQFAENLKLRMARASRTTTAAINCFRWLDELNAARARPFVPGWMTLKRKMFFAAYGDSPRPAAASVRLWLTKREGELAARRANYRLILDAARSSGLCDGLEMEGVTPFVVPLFVPDERIEAAVGALAEIGVRTGSYLFDVNRFLVEPDFRRCVTIPCHSGVSPDDVERMIGAVRSKL